MKNKPKKKIELEDIILEIKNLDAKVDLRIRDIAKETRVHVSKEIESLAVMVQKGFQEQSENLNEFKEEMGEFKEEMSGFRDKTEFSIVEIKSELGTMRGRFDFIDESLAHIDPMIKVLKLSDRDLEKRVTKIEHKLGMA